MSENETVVDGEMEERATEFLCRISVVMGTGPAFGVPVPIPVPSSDRGALVVEVDTDVDAAQA